MDDGVRADGDTVADDRRMVAGNLGHMHHGTLSDATVGSDLDSMYVATYRGTVPHRRTSADRDIPHHCGSRRNEGSGNSRGLTLLESGQEGERRRSVRSTMEMKLNTSPLFVVKDAFGDE